MWFETRSYDGFTLPAGDYDAVRIIIGAGEGHNWWCVMYPPLCIPGAENALEKYGSNANFVTGEGFEFRFGHYQHNLRNIFLHIAQLAPQNSIRVCVTFQKNMN